MAVALGVSLHARVASAEAFPLATGPAYRPFLAVNVEGGGARNIDADRFGWLAAGAAGLGFYDGNHVWDFTLGLRKVARDPYQVVLAAARIWVESGLSLHARSLWLPSHGDWGAGAGVGFSIIGAEAAVVFDEQRTKYAALYLHVPVGLILHHLFRQRG
jgi:hypothetical protein